MGQMLATRSDRKKKETNYNGNLWSVKRSDRATAKLSFTVCAPQEVDKKKGKKKKTLDTARN